MNDTTETVASTETSNSKEVEAFLNEQSKGLQPGDSITVPLTPEQMKALGVVAPKAVAGTEAEAPAEKPMSMDDLSIPPSPEMNPSNPNQEEKIKWNLKAVDIGDIEVSDFEKRLYVKAVLNDIPVRFPVKVKAFGITVSVEFRSRTTHEVDVIYSALQKDSDTKVVTDAPSYLSRLARYAAAVSLVDLNGKVYSGVQLPASMPIAEAVTALQIYQQTHIAPLVGVRWELLELAGRIFETKLAICHTNMIKPGFWPPAE